MHEQIHGRTETHRKRKIRPQGTKIHSYKSFIAIRNCDRM